MKENHEIEIIFTKDGFLVDVVPTSKKEFYFDDEVLESFSNDKYKALFELGFVTRDENFHASLDFLHYIANTFIESLSGDSDLEISRKPKPICDQKVFEIMRRVPYVVGVELINIEWLRNIWVKLSAIFVSEIDSYDGTVAKFLQEKNAAIQVVGRVFFHLVESKDSSYPFAFLATYSTGSKKKVDHLPLRNALEEYDGEQMGLLSLLSTVSQATDRSDFISELVESGELFSPLRFMAEEAYVFLKEVPIYESCGIVCRIPDWWKKKGNVRVSASVGEKRPSILGLKGIMDFKPEVYIGDLAMTRDEIEQLLTQADGLSFIKGKWVEVDQEKLKAALEAFDNVEGMAGVSFAEAMRMQLNGSNELHANEHISVEVTNGDWIRNMKSRLLDPVKIEDLSAGEDFLAALRNYQQTGFNWLHQMKELNFGALLADDMGLGKTVQIIALLEFLRQNGGAKVLLVIPASLLCNWQNEIDKFAPNLKYSVIHAKNKEIQLDESDIFITTYGMVTRLEELQNIKWDLLILDEAQAIKNAGTKQTKSVKMLQSTSRIAMTGTPIENSLTDLWSLFDFLNKGMLGSSKEFKNFTKDLKDDTSGYSRLRDIINPFILRRLKTDKSIISDLPDKIEVNAFTPLTKKQLVLYKALLKDISRGLEEKSGIDRKGLVLASIMKFKQICNHPDQYLGQKSFDESHSGKFEKLTEICETIAEKRERVLVFTQFKEMTGPIAEHLEKVFGRKGLILHGGTTVKKRGELVEQFNGEDYVPFMVLSLKAGGVGLNLTAANHVVHFDRWWNPAIENQATDRAFRIGQKKNVLVHKFITTGTIEEKIDLMLEEKKKLTDDVIATSGESWITEMDNEQLMNLFRLEV